MNRYAQEIERYAPPDEESAALRERVRQMWAQEGEAVLFRRHLPHFTVSGFVMNPALDRVLMVFHKIYDSYSWTGGHADGETDPHVTALREVQEETGAQHAFLQTGTLLRLDELPVRAHIRRGEPVEAHTHINFTYGVIVPQSDKLHIAPQENTAVRWLRPDELETAVSETHMLPVYRALIRQMQAAAQRQQAVLGTIARPLLRWYGANARDLPWRHEITPYRVWVSEIMLQQTRAEVVRDYFVRFMARFPDIAALAAAEPAEVNKYWEGLGYYSRAAHLHQAAQCILSDYGGHFPTAYEAVRALPGIGDYTAGAICSICYAQPTPAADGNVLRVCARLTDSFCPSDAPFFRRQILPLLHTVYTDCPPQGRGELTQAFIEIGATVCTPRAPRCTACPLEAVCMARQRGDETVLPKRLPKRKRRQECYTVFLLWCGDRLAVRQRPAKGLLAGLWELPHVQGLLEEAEMLAQAQAWGVKPRRLVRTLRRSHIFTHIEWEMIGVELHCDRAAEDFVWADRAELEKIFTLPTAFRQFIS